jgi:hypothetical protein
VSINTEVSMPSSPEVWAAIIAGSAALIGYPLTSYYTSRREARAKETAFKIECYQRFVNAFFGLAERRSFETQLEFTQSVNLMTLMASRDVLEALHELNTSYQSRSAESQWKILDKILYRMRRDMIGPADTVEPGYSFPVIVTSLPPTRESSPKHKQ